MSYFVIINGPLGCGKTTLAKKLASVLRGEHVPLDIILKENDLEDIEPDAGIRAESFIKALDIAIPTAEQSLKKGNIVIFDGCFYHKEALDHLSRKLDYPHYIFTLKAPVDVCVERDRMREKTLGEDAARAVHKLVSEHDFGNIIDAEKSFDETYKEILSYLPELGG